ncbi:MAG TPA: hypothetical protein VL501_08710 [Pyrinomonadaceae bacterium]|nr:hypothetical protein [Pyrinomonadaceae bacterium]
MTLSDRSSFSHTQACDLRSECRSEADRAFFRSILSTEDEVLVFRRDPTTGTYKMSTACCEKMLPPVQ